MSPVAESKIDVCLVAPALLMDERDRLAGVWLRATGAPSVELLQRPEASDAITSLQGAVAVFTDRDWADRQPREASVLDATQIAWWDDALPTTQRTPKPAWTAGLWFRHPPAGHAAATASRAQALNLLQLLNADAETHELEEAMRKDAHLSYQMLRLVNSPGIGGGRREIGSLAQAILMLGRAQLKRWINLVLFSARGGDARSTFLFAHVAMRARLMEQLAELAGHDKAQQETAFMAGMFSWLDALLAKPLADILLPLQLSETLRRGLLQGDGLIGDLIATARSYEAGEFSALPGQLARLDIQPDGGNLAALSACAWALEVVRSQGGGGA